MGKNGGSIDRNITLYGKINNIPEITHKFLEYMTMKVFAFKY